MQLSETGELEIIRRLTETLPGRSDLAVGAGDDCAVVCCGGEDLVLTSDPVISGVHFDADSRPKLIGRKALGRVLSDIAAMGAEPRWALINLVAPPETAIGVVEGIYCGINELAAEFSTAIAGGDVACGPVLELHVFGVGAIPRGRACLRSGASEGDLLFVTGSLGGSRLRKHLNVQPRVSEGIFLRDWVTAMIDISDGLVSEAGHLAKSSGVDCVIELSKLPVSADARRMKDDRSPLEHALYDGEDFELLFTIPSEKADKFITAWQNTFSLPCKRIGAITAGSGEVHLAGSETAALSIENMEPGYRHF